MGEGSSTPLKEKRVVVTRAAEQSRALVRALQEQGAVPVVLPLVAFGPPEDTSRLDEAIRQLALYDWIFFTSQNAIRALQERCQLLRVDLARATRGTNIAAVGPATAECAEAAGLYVSYVATKHQGVSLAEELADQVDASHVLLPRSDKANPELVESLNRLGAHVTEVVAYRTIRPGNADRIRAEEVFREGADAVLFFSPSAAHHLQEILGDEKFLEFSRRALFAAIGPVTGEALHACKVVRVLQARDTAVSAVIEALADAFAHKDSGLSAGVIPG
ncbi:MAG TPA: uroporphyrinogen-III synthase [Candidatus Limnocylindrales bacterium]|nr:uroporphyrinogen-III synthase [Candidatus Limnocylindrales bacterium]